MTDVTLVSEDTDEDAEELKMMKVMNYIGSHHYYMESSGIYILV